MILLHVLLDAPIFCAPCKRWDSTTATCPDNAPASRSCSEIVIEQSTIAPECTGAVERLRLKGWSGCKSSSSVSTSESLRWSCRKTRLRVIGWGVTRTPAFFINGRLVSGAQPENEFARVDEELNQRAQP